MSYYCTLVTMNTIIKIVVTQNQTSFSMSWKADKSVHLMTPYKCNHFEIWSWKEIFSRQIRPSNLQLCTGRQHIYTLHFLPANQDISSSKLVSLPLTPLANYKCNVVISWSVLQFSWIIRFCYCIFSVLCLLIFSM